MLLPALFFSKRAQSRGTRREACDELGLGEAGASCCAVDGHREGCRVGELY